MAKSLLRRHIRNGSEHNTDSSLSSDCYCRIGAVYRYVLLDHLGQPEVEHLHHAALGNYQVGTLYITMNDPSFVSLFERIGCLHRNIDHIVCGERAAINSI